MRKIDLTLILIVTFLIIIGLIAIYSAAGTRYLFRQLLFLPFGLVGLLVAFFTPRRIILGTAEILYILTLIMLITVLIWGTGPGAKRWFAIGAFNIQPSEVAKFTTTVVLAKYLSYRRNLKLDFPNIAGPAFLTITPVLLILAEPDLSTAISILPAFAAMLYWQGLRPLHILLLFIPPFSFVAGFSIYFWIPFFILLAIIVFLRMKFLPAITTLIISSAFGLLSPIVISLLKDYQRARIKNFFAPWLDPHGIGWNAIQSQIAIGSGRVLGKGYLKGTQKRLGFLPNRHTDFIFSSIAEEFGLLGSIVLLLLFFLFIHRILLTAYKTRDQNGALLCIGFAAIITYQIFVNIGMLLGVLPITGITLPFISYGGSSLLVTMTMLGLLLNVGTKPE